MGIPHALAALIGLGLVASGPAAVAQGSPTNPGATPPNTPPSLTAGASETAPHAPDRVLVKWQAASSGPARARARASVRGVASEDLGDSRSQVIKLPAGSDPVAVVAQLQAQPQVAEASLDYLRTPSADPTDPWFALQWGLKNTGTWNGSGGGTVGADIDAIEAWKHTTGSATVVVAVLDTGIRPANPDLSDRITPGRDFVGAEADTPVEDDDPTDTVVVGNHVGHGTHVAGIIGAHGNNTTGITGVAQDVRIMPLRVCGWSTTANDVACPDSALIAAINYAGANGADIANMSLSGTAPQPLLKDAMADNPAVLMVASAGNDTLNLEATPYYPCAYNPTDPYKPDSIDNVICVAATGRSDALASFSNWGAVTVDLGAPGENIVSYDSDAAGNTATVMSGTSQAAPMVSGTAALMLAYEPTATVSQLRTAILGSVEPLPGLAGKVATGGRANADRAFAALDTVFGPYLQITGAPSGTVATRSASLTLTGIRAGLTGFQCKLDNGAYATCTSPYNLSGLADGSHTVSVIGSYSSGSRISDASPSQATWTVDTTPETNITSGPSGTVTTGSATFTFTSDDPAAGFDCQLDSSGFAPCSSPKTYTGLGDGWHTFSVRAHDGTGHTDATPASASWLVAIPVQVPQEPTNPAPSSPVAPTPDTPSAPAAPSAPAGFAAAFPKKKTAAVSWSAANATSYSVRISKKNSTKKFGKWQTTGAPSITFKSLKKKGKYLVQVSATGPGGTSAVTSWGFKQLK